MKDDEPEPWRVRTSRNRTDDSTRPPGLVEELIGCAFIGISIGALITAPTLHDWWSHESALVLGLTLCTLFATFVHWYDTMTKPPDQ